MSQPNEKLRRFSCITPFKKYFPSFREKKFFKSRQRTSINQTSKKVFAGVKFVNSLNPRGGLMWIHMHTYMLGVCEIIFTLCLTPEWNETKWNDIIPKTEIVIIISGLTIFRPTLLSLCRFCPDLFTRDRPKNTPSFSHLYLRASRIHKTHPSYRSQKWRVDFVCLLKARLYFSSRIQLV